MSVWVFIVAVVCISIIFVVIPVTEALTCGDKLGDKGSGARRHRWTWLHTCSICMAALLLLLDTVTYIGITRSKYTVIESEPLATLKDGSTYNVEDIDGATRLVVFIDRGDKYAVLDVSDPLFREHIGDDESPRLETRRYKFVGMKLERKVACVNLPESVEQEFAE